MKISGLKKTIAVAVFAVMGFLVVNLFAQFGGGDGTEANPWQVETATHLNNVRNYVGRQNNDKYFVQTADIDLGVAPWNEGVGWSPIGLNTDTSFRGKYDGNGHIIANLVINNLNASNQSLFGWIDGARSYKIYASDNIESDGWGEPIREVGEDVTVYIEPVGDRKKRFYRVVASDGAP